MDNQKYHVEIIICPNCKTEQKAKVLHTDPFNSYVHTCKCGFIITESDWEEVENLPKPAVQHIK